MRTLLRIVDALSTIGGLLVALLLATQLIVVALRYVFSLGWPWATDLLVYTFFLSVLFPLLLVLVRNKTVRVDVFYAGWPKSRRTIVDRIALLCLFVPAMGYAAYASYGTTMNSWRVLESSPTFGGLPGYFLLKTMLSLTFASLALVGVYLALRKSPYQDEGDAQ